MLSAVTVVSLLVTLLKVSQISTEVPAVAWPTNMGCVLLVMLSPKMPLSVAWGVMVPVTVSAGLVVTVLVAVVLPNKA